MSLSLTTLKSLNITVDPEKYEPLRKNINLFYGTSRGIVQFLWITSK